MCQRLLFSRKAILLVLRDRCAGRQLNHASDAAQENPEVWAKLLGFDDRGKVRLSMKAVDQETGEEAE